MHADGPQLHRHLLMLASRLGLALERAELTADLAEQVAEAHEVGLGGLEPTLGPLPALPVFEDARRLLDHRPPVLRPRIEDGSKLALADDDVLLTADARVGEQLLDVQ